ncbi:alpha/beta fold hydrolase [Azohydromonas caseinilytica]|uniref:Alpha/beta hydrolase n=1 Tax=Azohydromonas caseinilytica TaxID=2728836 RepID=A0A848F5U8_9BURK|nr:alpha/beta hydrolase [Azohydromonas caseinilytica]NML14964.1 alpha/beta hydrolase [Azohydromonas caseinilytica]
MTYQPRVPSTSRFLDIRRLRYHVQSWGDPALATPQRPPLVLLHGWMDVGASFQFLVDALTTPRWVIAPDWRGFGRTSVPGADSYWFPDYLGDLDVLLDAFSPDAPVDLVGHSMGGNVAMVYAGVRPRRVRRLVNLEGFGMPDSRPAQAPSRLEKWLDELKSPPRLSPYPSLEAVARRLQMNDPFLGVDKAQWLAAHWAEPDGEGRWRLRADPAHKQVNPVLYRKEEVLAAWQRIQAPLLWVEGEQTEVLRRWGAAYPREDFEARMATLPRLQRALLPDCGHMLHHDQPQAVAALLEEFLDAGS